MYNYLLNILTLENPEVINMLLLPVIYIHYPTDRWWEPLKLSGRRSYHGLKQNSSN